MADAAGTVVQTPEQIAAAAAAAANKPWFDGVDAETSGYLKNRGWEDKDAKTVALEAIKAHREAERFIGAPAAELVRLPKDANDPSWNSVYQRLGAPGDAKGYDLSGVKFSDNTALDEDFVKSFSEAANAAHISKDAAPVIARAVVKFMEEAEVNETAVKQAAVAQERDTLLKNWGANVNTNMVIAKNAAAALGVTAAEIAALESTIGYSRVMEMFRSVGTKIGEDRFVRNEAPGGSGVMTVDQAKAKLSSLKSDKEWGKKLMAGNVAAKLEEDQLNKLIMGLN